MFAPLVGLCRELLQQQRAPVDQHAGISEGEALLGAFNAQELDDWGKSGGLVVGAADERLQEVVDGALRMAVVV